jgi:hypothetical protein
MAFTNESFERGGLRLRGRETAASSIKYPVKVPGAPHIRGSRMCGIKSRSNYLHSHSFQKQE